MKNKFTLIVFLLLHLSLLSSGQKSIDISGTWQFKIDPKNVGLKKEWFNLSFTDKIHLPGSLQEQGYGNDVTPATTWYGGAKQDRFWATNPIFEKYRQPGHVKIFSFLQPDKEYTGVAWYQKKVQIPADWLKQRIVLYLERVHWGSEVWINGIYIGKRTSLGTEQTYDLTGRLKKGENTVSLRIDNSPIVDIGLMPSSVSNQTQDAWNGVIGTMKMISTDKVWLEDIQIFPNLNEKKIKINYTICTKVSDALETEITFNVCAEKGRNQILLPLKRIKLNLIQDTTTGTLEYSLGNIVHSWDEFHPFLYRLNVKLIAKSPVGIYNSSSSAPFGMREITTKGTMFQLNGQPISLRGNLDCALFPIKGYPYMDASWWRQLWKKYKNWGFNNIRFHSWCPPRAAFNAADEVGIYLEPEVSEWSAVESPEQEAWLKQESERMLKIYGNSPSFILMDLGNENAADFNFMKRLIAEWKKDKRRLYTGKPNGWPKLKDYDYSVECWLDTTRTRYQYGWPPEPNGTWFNSLQPQTVVDFSKAVSLAGRPLISHEIGQRCVYPNIAKELPKYTGTLQPTYLEIGKDQLKERGMWEQLPLFVQASGLWQVQQYKEEIEAHLRTPGYGGFHLLSLQDFTGQGSAPVGVLDAFYDTRGYINASEFREFCNSTLLLAKLPKRILKRSDTLKVQLDLYNYGPGVINAYEIICEIKDGQGKLIRQLHLSGRKFQKGSLSSAGNFEIPLNKFSAPLKYNLLVSIPGTVIHNNWDFWIYPDQINTVDTSKLLIVNKLDTTVYTALKEGKTVVVFGDPNAARGALKTCFSGYYWSTFGMNGGESSALSLLCNPKLPLFKFFPTDFNTNWQWWDILTHTRPMILDEYGAAHPFPKNYNPAIQLIDSWLINRKLAALVEGKVDKGKIIVTSIDLNHDLNKRLAARQLRYSILKYAASNEFRPSSKLTEAMLRDLFLDSGVK